ncbi:MAG: acyltransferase [Oscillospiraceae bacterium]|nr:acyltransferase [Oscillospiraceae bacterium]
MANEMKKQNHDALDLLKYISAFLVVFTHVHAFHESLPIGVAVSRFTIPQFYMVSAYFFFRRVNQDADNPGWRKQCLWGFLRRVAKLYCCWLLVQAPLMYVFGGWYAFGYEAAGSAMRSAFLLIKNVLLSNTFPASWYLMALMIGTAMVTYLDRWIGNTGLLMTGLFFFLICCANSGYLNLVNHPIHLFYPPTSFLSSVLWLTVGKMIAEEHPVTQRFRELPHQKKILILLSAVGLFFAEYFLCLRKEWAGNTDAMLSLIPVCPMIFMTVLDAGRSIPYAREMRAASTVIYCSHGMMLTLLSHLGAAAGIRLEVMPMAAGWYLLAILLCNLLAIGMMYFQKKDGFRWLSCFW